MTSRRRPEDTLALVGLSANGVLAVCGLVLALGSLDGSDPFLVVCGAVMLGSGVLSFALNFRRWRRARGPR